MKKLIVAVVVCLSASQAFAVDADDIRAGYGELRRACNQPGVDRPGSAASRECASAYNRTQTNARQLDKQIVDSANRRDHDRQRIQQEELWREEARRSRRSW